MREAGQSERIIGKLGDLLPIKYGKSLPASVRDSSGSVPVLGSSGLVGTHAHALTTGPTIVVGRKGNVGAIHYSTVPCWPIDTAYFVEPPAGHSAAYYRYLLTSLNLSRLDRSTAIPGLSRDDYNAVQVSVHPPDRQEEVVAEIDKQFSRLDEAVANLQRVKANLKRYKAAVLKAAVEGRLVEAEASLARRDGRGYETGEQLLRRVLVDRKANWAGKGKYVEPAMPDVGSLPALPDGWIWATAEAVCDPVVDCHNKTAPYVNSGIPLVRTTNIRDGQLLMDGMRFVDQPTYEFWSRRCPPAPGDVLFTREAPMGETCIVPAGMTVCLGQRTMLMRPSPAITASFLLAALMSPVIADLIDRVAVGSGVKHLRVGDVERLPIPLPPEAEQVRIVAELDRLLSVQKAVESEVDGNLQRAGSLRSAVLVGSLQPGP